MIVLVGATAVDGEDDEPPPQAATKLAAVNDATIERMRVIK